MCRTRRPRGGTPCPGMEGACPVPSPRSDSLRGQVRSSTPIDLQQVSRLAGALAALGVTKGDRVLIYMPLIPETIIAMLATVRLGAIHSVVFGGECFARGLDHAAEPRPSPGRALSLAA